MKRKGMIMLAALLLITGLVILLRPVLKTAAFRQAERQKIRQFEQYCEDTMRENQTDPGEGKEAPAPKQDFRELWEACVQYNGILLKSQKAGFTAQLWEAPAIRLSDYDWEQEIFGYISIPSADIEAPLYLGGSMENLNKGAAVLGQTSMPIGGSGTHCVVAGHRTWNAILHPFAGLEQVQVGDLVYLTNPWQTLSYRVTETQTILPDDSDRIRIRPGQDLLSVFTCAYPNTKRVLVTCERIPEEE